MLAPKRSLRLGLALLVFTGSTAFLLQATGSSGAHPAHGRQRTRTVRDHSHCGAGYGRHKRGRRGRSCPPVGSSSGITKGDFNCDGIADLAIGVPDDNVPYNGGKIAHAGSVEIVYANSNGTGLPNTVDGSHYWFRGNLNGGGANVRLFDPPSPGERFGAALAAGDFNGDGCSDLAIGLPNATVNGVPQAGAVIVMYGTPLGLDAAPNLGKGRNAEFWTAANTAVRTPQAYAHFGAALAWGNFDGLADADLAIGIPNQDVVNTLGVTVRSAGAVLMLYGDNGLNDQIGQFIAQGIPSFGGFPPFLDGSFTSDHFGATLTAGDFNNDGISDLVVGIPNKAVASVPNAGRVDVIYGRYGQQLRADAGPGELLLDERFTSLGPSSGAHFGASLAVGNFNGDGTPDLAVGAPDKTINGQVSAGAVDVIFMKTGGTPNTPAIVLREGSCQNGGCLSRAPCPGCRFGYSLAVGDFNNDTVSDLAVGAPFETLSDYQAVEACTLNSRAAGDVHVLYGGSSPFSRTQFLFAGGNNAQAQPKYQWAGALFGFSLTAWKFRGAAFPSDLVIGAPGDPLLDSFPACFFPPTEGQFGAVYVMPGPLNLSSSANRRFSQAYGGVYPFSSGGSSGTVSLQGTAEVNEHFGWNAY